MSDLLTSLREDLAGIAAIEATSDLMTALCDVSGLGFAVIAEVSDNDWTACAVLDRIKLGVVQGQRLDVSMTLCNEVRKTRHTIVIDHASADPHYCAHAIPKFYGFESYISVPIVLTNGDYLGNLCALDRGPKPISDPRVQLMFHCFATLIAQHVEGHATRQTKRVGPLNKHIVGNLRGLFVAMLAEASTDAAHPVPDPAVRQLAARVANEGHRLRSLINDVLTYARGRLNGGMPGYIWKVDDLHSRLKAVVANTVAAHPNRTIITNISFDQPVDCDPARIQELASNLLNNALAHGAPSGPVSFIASAQNNDLEIAVWNEGTVISTQALRHVFSPALRPGSHPPGAHHALYTCAEIVRAHLGTIRVTSSPTEGTQFVARIPVARSQRLH